MSFERPRHGDAVEVLEAALRVAGFLHAQPFDPPPPSDYWSLSRTDGLWHVIVISVGDPLVDYRTARLGLALRALAYGLRHRA